MPMWRCPHCGTPQAETARCWVCRRSSTACATCQNFRRSVAAQLGYCGLDRERRPLRGDEIRACWEASTISIEVVPTDPERRVPQPFHPVEDGTPVRKLEFVEVGSVATKAPRKAAAGGSTGEAESLAPVEPSASVSPGEPRWSLWGDAEV